MPQRKQLALLLTQLWLSGNSTTYIFAVIRWLIQIYDGFSCYQIFVCELIRQSLHIESWIEIGENQKNKQFVTNTTFNQSSQSSISANHLQISIAANHLQISILANHLQSSISANQLQSSISANHLQSSISANHLQISILANHLQSSISANHLQSYKIAE